MTKMRWMAGAAMVGAVALLTAHAQAQGASGDSSSGAGYSGTGSSPSTSTDTSTSTTTTETSQQLQGRVQNFDRTNNTLTLSGSDKALKIDSSTQVMKNGSQATLDDIKEGDQVRASFSGTGDMLHVKRLDVMSRGSSGSSGTGTGTGTMGSGSSGTSGTGSSGTSIEQQSKTQEKSTTEQKGY